MKTHFAVKQPYSLNMVSACGTGRRIDASPFRVDCLRCKSNDDFILALEEVILKREADFQAQTPRTIVPRFGAVNDDGVMECRNCHGTLWRERPRSLFSYHYVCSGCGKNVYPLTETGMCT